LQRHQRRVFNLILRMLQDYEEISEITQKAFLAAWKGLLSLRGEARFAIRRYCIVYHNALKQLERCNREQSLQTAIEGMKLNVKVQKRVFNAKANTL
jgi:RNA polymerase sigma-70 factor, ECF subfamily